MSEKLMTISELAKVFKINQHTIRHYEEKGLLQPSEVSENGYRKYGLSEAYQLSFWTDVNKVDTKIDTI